MRSLPPQSCERSPENWLEGIGFTARQLSERTPTSISISTPDNSDIGTTGKEHDLSQRKFRDAR
jgi:hypothetical protein